MRGSIWGLQTIHGKCYPEKIGCRFQNFLHQNKLVFSFHLSTNFSKTHCILHFTLRLTLSIWNSEAGPHALRSSSWHEWKGGGGQDKSPWVHRGRFVGTMG